MLKPRKYQTPSHVHALLQQGNFLFFRRAQSVVTAVRKRRGGGYHFLHLEEIGTSQIVRCSTLWEAQKMFGEKVGLI